MATMLIGLILTTVPNPISNARLQCSERGNQSSLSQGSLPAAPRGNSLPKKWGAGYPLLPVLHFKPPGTATRPSSLFTAALGRCVRKRHGSDSVTHECDGHHRSGDLTQSIGALVTAGPERRMRSS